MTLDFSSFFRDREIKKTPTALKTMTNINNPYEKKT